MGVRAWLSNNREPIHAWTEVLSHLAQVCALLIAAFWTYKTFLESERPALEAKPDVSSDLSWLAPSGEDFCDGLFGVEFKNLGKRSLDVQRLDFKIWLAPKPIPTVDKPLSIDPDVLKKQGSNLEETSRTIGALIDHFPPDTSHHDTFTWRFKGADKGKFVVFEVTTEGIDSEGKQFSKGASNWDPVCGYSKGH